LREYSTELTHVNSQTGERTWGTTCTHLIFYREREMRSLPPIQAQGSAVMTSATGYQRGPISGMFQVAAAPMTLRARPKRP